jgi:hypothetical protein
MRVGTRTATVTLQLLCVIVLATLSASCTGDPPSGMSGSPHRVVFDTAPMTLDRLYPSMTGPSERVAVDFSELDWVTAYRTDVVDVQTDEPMGGEFFCHSQLQMQNGTRLMVTATGAQEIRFPEGFGMTVSDILGDVGSDQRSLSFFGMLLNNHVPDINQVTKVRATIEYWNDEDAGHPLKRLYKTGLTMHVEDLAAYEPPPGQEGSDDVSTHCALVNNQTAHWLVPPGPQTTRKQYSGFLGTSGTVHFAVVHLHNYGRYFRFTDVTLGKQLWQTDVVYDRDRMQITEIPTYSSSEGFRLEKDHVYEIEAFYDNTTDHDIDAMAQVDLYWHPDGNATLSYPTGPVNM